jgi:uncharacterized protein DUF6600/FecR-like protein
MFRSVIALLLASSAWAQFQAAPQQYPPPQASYPPYQTPPNQAPLPSQPMASQDEQGRDLMADQQHGVARIRLAQGDVNVKRGDNGELTGAIMNAPLLSRDHLETSPGSRAEVELDAGLIVRVAPDTDVAFANLIYQRSQLQLGIGTLIVRVVRDGQSQLEIDTPSVAFRPLAQGDYRISVFDNGTSQITVRSGRMEMSGPRGSQIVNAGQSMLVRGDSSDPEFQPSPPAPRDQLDDWSASRDAELLSSRSYQYVSQDVQGAEDLDRYGNWVPSQYGQVWAPQAEPPDWSPYSNGQWTWADYYGWTWIGYEPWGWAPYHYGRWFWNTGVGWCWWPGARVGIGFGFRWSPALVGFFGFGGGLGWVSLAPYELFHPWWGRGFGGYDSFRAYGLQRYYRNAGIRGGAMTANLGSFAGAGHRYSVATGGQLSSASLYRGGIPVSRTASSYRFTDHAVASNPRFSQVGSRSFFSRSQQFNAPRSTFNNAPSGGGGGWQRFGSPGNFAPARPQQNYASRPNAGESGWHTFGNSQPRYSAPFAPNYNYRAPTGPRSTYSAPHYSAPSAPKYKAPAAPSSHGNSGGGGHPGGGHSGGGGGRRGR